MELISDFIDFVELLGKYKVKYMVVGGYAVMAHGEPRFTEDFDIWIKPSVENADGVSTWVFGQRVHDAAASDGAAHQVLRKVSDAHRTRSAQAVPGLHALREE